jgi:hypothetical protein
MSFFMVETPSVQHEIGRVSETLNVQKEDHELRRKVPSSLGSTCLGRKIGILAAGLKSIFLPGDN